MLAADSLAGAMWRIDFDGDGRSLRAKLWLQHESMAHVEDNLPPPPQPGINGLRYSAETGYVYYTTTGQKLFYARARGSGHVGARGRARADLGWRHVRRLLYR
jgi:hypothetical protein